LASEAPGVVVGFAAEARIARRLGWRLAIAGAMATGAEAASRRLLDEGCDALISFGLAGGLDPALRPGDLLVPVCVVADGVRYKTDTDLSRRLGGQTMQTVLGADAVAANAEDKQRLLECTSAHAVDLESGAVARVAAAHRVPFAVLRAICDPADRDLPAAARATLDAHGAIAMGRLIASIATGPGQLPALVRLAADASAARRSLLIRVRRIAQVPP
jgi:adenosylhomocysteine nucleosidase